MTYQARICEQCSKEYTNTKKRSRQAWLRQRYCSPACTGVARKVDTDPHSCQHCGTVFSRKPHISVAAWGSVTFCSRSCADVAKDITHLKPHQFKPGNISGRHFTSENSSGEANPKWKGDAAGYAAKHIWMRNHYGTPQECEHCGTKEDRRYQWANVSGEYLRERTDWLRLCIPCHKKYDIAKLGGKIRARAPKLQPSKVCVECNTEFFKNPKLSKTQWQATECCGKACAAKRTGRKLLGTRQSDETCFLKTQKLTDRWANNAEWRENRINGMVGNQYARKHPKAT